MILYINYTLYYFDLNMLSIRLSLGLGDRMLGRYGRDGLGLGSLGFFRGFLLLGRLVIGRMVGLEGLNRKQNLMVLQSYKSTVVYLPDQYSNTV